MGKVKYQVTNITEFHSSKFCNRPCSFSARNDSRNQWFTSQMFQSFPLIYFPCNQKALVAKLNFDWHYSLEFISSSGDGYIEFKDSTFASAIEITDKNGFPLLQSLDNYVTLDHLIIHTGGSLVSWLYNLLLE